MNKPNQSWSTLPARLMLAATVLAGAGTAHAQTFSLSNTDPANPTTGDNYYTAADGNAAGGSGGALTETQSQFELNANGASLDVASGSLDIVNTQFGMFIGQNASASLDVSGGTLTLDDTHAGGFGEFFVAFGNSSGVGTLTQEGGLLNIIGGASGLYFGRSGGSGSLTLTGGVLNEEDTVGTTLGDGGGTGSITFGLGSGVFEETATDALTFSSNSSYINFVSGSFGELSLDGANAAYFNSLVNSGEILIDGSLATTSEFAYSTSGSQGVLELATAAAAPEPGTWALMFGGFAMLLVLQRKRNKA